MIQLLVVGRGTEQQVDQLIVRQGAEVVPEFLVVSHGDKGRRTWGRSPVPARVLPASRIGWREDGAGGPAGTLESRVEGHQRSTEQLGEGDV
jgi:hypothetical protein